MWLIVFIYYFLMLTEVIRLPTFFLLFPATSLCDVAVLCYCAQETSPWEADAA